MNTNKHNTLLKCSILINVEKTKLKIGINNTNIGRMYIVSQQFRTLEFRKTKALFFLRLITDQLVCYTSQQHFHF